MRFFAQEDKVKVSGRTLFVDNARYLGYSGSSISFTFTGKRADICMWSDADKWDKTLKGWVAVYIDEEEIPSMRIKLIDGENVYTVYKADEEQTVTIKVVKYSEAAFTKCAVKYIEIDTDKLCEPPVKRDRRIEIIGDSITCGYGVEAENELQTFDTATENPMRSYSMRMARLLNAEVNLVSWSGIGVISNWVPEDATEPFTEWLMPPLYEFTDAASSRDALGESRENWQKWEFSKYEPQLIVINLGTNDTSYCKDITSRQQLFKREYKKFVETVREHNATAYILCVLGTMEQKLCHVLDELIAEMKLNDEKLEFMWLPEQLEADGKGADYHPSDLTQQKTAELISDRARQLIKW